jgi:hypothetical protein
MRLYARGTVAFGRRPQGAGPGAGLALTML